MEPLNVPGLREEVDEEHVPGDGGADERAAVGVAGQVAEAVGVAEVVDVGVDLGNGLVIETALSLFPLLSLPLSNALSLSILSLLLSSVPSPSLSPSLLLSPPPSLLHISSLDACVDWQYCHAIPPNY